MSDPINEIFNGTPDGIDEEELQLMEAAEQQRLANIQQQNQVQEEEQQPGGATASPTQPQQQQTQQPAQPTQNKEEPKRDQQSIYEEGFDLGDAARATSQQAVAAQVGLIDFGTDLVNMVPGVNIPKIPKFENDVAQAGREISSVLVPLVTGGIAAKGLQGAGAARSKIMADAGFQRLATFGFNTGWGVAVDTISSTSEGDNLTGMLKQNFPAVAGFISDDIATLETDSPDIKKKKNIMEGFGLGLFTDLVGPAARLIGSKFGARRAARYIPESEKGTKLFKTEAASTVEEEVAQQVTRRSEALDELGDYNTSIQPKQQTMSGEEYYIQSNAARVQDMSPEDAQALYKEAWDSMDDATRLEYDNLARQAGPPDFQEPVLGVHDMFEYSESGIRSVDDLGVISAKVDNARILNNIDSVNGRMSNMLSEGAMKYALSGSAEYRQITSMLGEQLSQAGRYGFETNTGKIVSADTIDKAVDNLTEKLGLLTRAEAENIKKNIPDLKGEVARTFKELIDFDQTTADALLQTSLAGQVADMSEGLRVMGKNGSIDRGLDQILDRMEMLMVADYNTASKANLFQRLKGRFITSDSVADNIARMDADFARAKREAKQSVDTLRELKAERPDLLEPMMFAYEASGGNVKTVAGLNNYFQQSTGTFSKAFIDRSPEVPSVIMRGFWGTVYNNALFAIGTPLRALASTAGLLIERPIATMGGAMMAGDKHTLQRGAFVLQDVVQRTRNSFGYMAETFGRSGRDPDYTGGMLARESYMIQDDKQMLALHSYADAMAANGEFGPQVMMQQVEALNDVARSPLLRFGNRAMGALDGFTQAWIASGEAASRTFDKLAAGTITTDMLEQVKKAEYDSMFKADDKGRMVITDSSVKAAAGEINMNLNNPMTEGLSELINRVPALKPHLLFTRTPVNAANFGATHLPFSKFISDFNDFSRPIDQVPLEKLEPMLASRGIPFDENAVFAYNQIRAELKGRKAIGTLAIIGAVGLFMTVSITSDGIDNPQVMKARRELGWKPRYFKTPLGNVSYDGIPGISDLLATTATVLDNMESLEGSRQEELLNALSFIVGTAITDKTGMTNMEAFFKVMQGNPNEINRWAASFIPSATTPGANGLLELQKLWVPQLKVVEDKLDQMLLNRSLAKAALPDQYDWVDGGKVGEGDNFFARAFNIFSPFKISGKISPEKQFLIDIEYDNRPSMETDGQGVTLNSTEQSEVYNEIAKEGYFKQEIKRIMNSTTGKEFREEVKRAQQSGAAIDVKKFEGIQSQLDSALNLAKERAVARVDYQNNGSISQRRFEQKKKTYFTRTGDVESILSIPK